jgi:uncharacterized protein (UPF0335 family)
MSDSPMPNRSNALLKSYVERIERISDDIAAHQADLAEVFSQAKGDGFAPRALRKLILKRREDTASANELDATVALYAAAIGDAP